jgi:Fe-S-cluster containining protein
MAELVALRIQFDQRGWPASGEDCVWYDAETRRCRHHQWRPEICEEFEVGGAGCRHVRELNRKELRIRIAQAARDAGRSRPPAPRPSHTRPRSGR